MALTDNLVVKVQPATGDTFVKNLVDSSNAAANGAGTLALVDDAGMLGWNVQGARDGTLSGGIGYEGAAITVAVRFKAASRLADYLTYFSVATSPTGNGFGAQVTNNGTATGALRLREAIGGSGFSVIGSPTYTTGNYFTVVIRLCDTTFSPGTIAGFLKQASRTNNNPDYSLAATEAVRSGFGAIDTLILGAAGQNLTFTDIAVWTRALTDAEGAAVADDIRGQLSEAAAGTPVSSDLAATYGVSAYASASLAASYAISSATTSVSSDLAAAYGVTAYVGASIAASYSVAGTPASGSFVTDAWINNTGTPRGAVAVSYTWVSLGRIGSLTGKTLTEGTATLSAGSILTATGLPLGAGFMLGAVLGADATTDDVYYEAGTVA